MRHFSCCVLFEVAVFKTQTGGGTITTAVLTHLCLLHVGPLKVPTTNKGTSTESAELAGH